MKKMGQILDSNYKMIPNIFQRNIEGSTIELSKNSIRHLKVLRVKKEKIKILSGDGNVAIGIFDGEKKIKVIERFKESRLHTIDVYLPMIKNSSHRFIMRNITAYPIKNIYLFNSTYSVAKRKWQSSDERLLIEGIKQSGNPYLPKLSDIIGFNDIKCDDKNGYFGSLFFKEKKQKPKNFISKIVIGPEGGFTEKEEKLLITNGFQPINLSPYILRTEIAIFSLLARCATYRVPVSNP